MMGDAGKIHAKLRMKAILLDTRPWYRTDRKSDLREQDQSDVLHTRPD